MKAERATRTTAGGLTSARTAFSRVAQALWQKHLVWATGVLAAIAWFDLAVEAADSTNMEPIRFAFSSQMFTEVNENDAKASVKAWALAIAHQHGVAMSPEPIVLSSFAELKQSLVDATIDGAAVPTEEYLELPPELQSTNILLSSIGSGVTEEYLLLANADSGVTNLEGLRGGNIILFDNVRASLVPTWLDVILSEQHLGAAADYFGQVLKAQKLTKVVLPVFFRQQQACIVTRRGFVTMCELNPQVSTQLRVLATSPKLVPSVGFFRRTYVSPLRDAMLSALRGLEKSAAGSEVLTLFQTDQMREASPAVLESTRDLINRREHLKSVVLDESFKQSLTPLKAHEVGSKSQVAVAASGPEGGPQ